MLTLRLNETFLFDDLARISWNRARPLLDAEICRRHRTAFAGRTWTAEIIEEIGACRDCQPAQMPSRVIGTLAYLARRRNDPDLDPDDYFETATFEDAWGELLEAIRAAAGGVQAADRSDPITKPGDGDSLANSEG